MAIELKQLLGAYCAELLKAHSTFLIMQRSAYFELFKDEFNRLALNDSHFIGLEEVSLSVYLRPKRRSILYRWWYKLMKKPIQPVFELVPDGYPDAIHCTVVFRRQGSEFKASTSFDEKNIKDPVYVDLT